jgi:hypothetical protein
MDRSRWVKERKRKEEENRKIKKRENKEKCKKRKGQCRHFTTSIQQVKPLYQIFFKTASAPSKKPLH